MVYCCSDLVHHVTAKCDKHDDWECPDKVIVATKSGYGLPIRDGGSSFIQINFCPFCGTNLSEEG